MSEKKSHFEVSSVGELKKRLYPHDERPSSVVLDPRGVPEQLCALIPYAERWGIGDDIARNELVLSASQAEIDELKRVVRDHDDLLDEWLAGPAATNPPFTKEYLAFTHMRMAADGV